MAQCPPTSWLPQNIRLITHDVYQPSPIHMQGVYDLVHVQNWLCIWRNETSEKLIRNLLSLLSRFPEKKKRKNCPASSVADSVRTRGWVSRLGEYLDVQARLVAFDRFGSSSEHQQLWSIGVLQACEEFASNLERKAQSNGDIERAAELRSSAEKAAVEMLNGVGIYSELVVAVAQKESTKPVQRES
ncbi:MAG: hypothetical protein Q9177_001585 [Variospora cf. flavescens]